MKIETKTKETFRLTVNRKELQTVQLALALMYENDYTHENWLKKISSILPEMMDVLGMDESYL